MGTTIRFMTPVNVAPVTTGSFATVDLSAHTEADDTGAILHFVNTSTTKYIADARHGDSTDLAFATSIEDHRFAVAGLNSSDEIDVNIGNAAVEAWLIGFTGSEWEFRVNAAVFNTVAANTWESKSVSSYFSGSPTDTALVMVGCNGNQSRQVGFRHPDSADTKVYGGSSSTDSKLWSSCKDGTNVAAFRNSTNINAYIFARCTTAADIVFNTEVANITGAGFLTTKSIHADAIAVVGNFQALGTDSKLTIGPKNGITGTHYDPIGEGATNDEMDDHGWLVECDANGDIEVKGADPNIWWAYFTAGGAGGGVFSPELLNRRQNTLLRI